MSSTAAPITAEFPLELTIVMPCLNEAETLATCIDKANAALRENGISGEVVVADNGSTDGSQQIAHDHGARLIPVPIRGYGAALNAGILASAQQVRSDGRRRRQLRLRARSALPRRAPQRRRTRHGQSLPRRHRPRRDATAAQVSRQPRAQLPRPLALSHAHRRLPLRHPRLLRRRLQTPRSPHYRHGVRQRDGRQIRAARPAHGRGPDHAQERRPQPPAAPPHMARRLASSALSADVLAALALPLSPASR